MLGFGVYGIWCCGVSAQLYMLAGLLGDKIMR